MNIGEELNLSLSLGSLLYNQQSQNRKQEDEESTAMSSIIDYESRLKVPECECMYQEKFRGPIVLALLRKRQLEAGMNKGESSCREDQKRKRSDYIKLFGEYIYVNKA